MNNLLMFIENDANKIPQNRHIILQFAIKSNKIKRMSLKNIIDIISKLQ